MVTQEEILQSSEYKPVNQIASLADSETAIYSASVVDKATVACKCAFQLTAQPQMVKTIPVRDLLVSKSLA
jgi:hypothetical protein